MLFLRLIAMLLMLIVAVGKIQYKNCVHGPKTNRQSKLNGIAILVKKNQIRQCTVQSTSDSSPDWIKAKVGEIVYLWNFNGGKDKQGRIKPAQWKALEYPRSDNAASQFLQLAIKQFDGDKTLLNKPKQR